MILNTWKKIFRTYFTPTFYGGGGPTNTTSTVTQQNIPDWLRPQTEALMGAATKQVFQTTEGADGKQILNGINSYVPYSTNPSDYVAGLSPMQQTAYAQAGQLQMPGQYAQGSNIIGNAALGLADTGNAALGYGAIGQQAGNIGQNLGVAGGAKYGALGEAYGAQGAGYGAQGATAGLAAADKGWNAAMQYGNQAAGYGLQAGQAGQAGQALGTSAANIYGAQATNLGSQAANLANAANMYGQGAAGYGAAGATQAIGTGANVANQAGVYAGQAANAGQDYANLATNPTALQAYMNPYQQAVTDTAKAGAIRDYQLAQVGRQANAAKAGAYGGSRQAIENAEAQRNLATQLSGIQTQGLQDAYKNAIANQQFQSTQGLAGLNAAQQGLGNVLSAGNLGLAGTAQGMAGQQAGLAGVGAANQAYQTGIQGVGAGLQAAGVGLQGTAQGIQGAQAGVQGAGTALQGVGQAVNSGQLGLAGIAQGMQGAGLGMQGAGVGLQGVQQGMAGTAQGMQGAGVGLQGTQTASGAYNALAGTGTQLGTLGAQQLAAQQGIIGLNNALGQQQQDYQQQIINNAINNYATAQQYPQQQLAFYNALLKGQSLPVSSTQNYSAAPSTFSQIAGLAGTGIGAYQALSGKKEGGIIKMKNGGVVDLALRNALQGA